jgi:DNA-binding PadR family transcriptional regulator
MAVRDALVGLLTLGPAYGLQLHAELAFRAPHRAHTNVGQIYGTLERLVTAGLVSRVGVTVEGFPLYELTSPGRSAAQTWLYGKSIVSATDWNDVLDHILIARAVDPEALEAVVAGYEVILTREPDRAEGEVSDTTALASAAARRFSDAVLGWLGDVRREMSSSQGTNDQNTLLESPIPAHGYQLHRPKRGRPSA